MDRIRPPALRLVGPALVDELPSPCAWFVTLQSAPSSPAKPAARRSSSRRPAAAATPVAETASDAKPTRKRRPMTAEEKKAVSERMTASWAERRKKAAK